MVWHWIVKSWLQRKAQERIYEAVAQSVRQQASTRETGQANAAAARADVALLFPLGVEAGGMQDLLEGVCTTRAAEFVVHQGRLRDRVVVLVETGVGCVAACRAAEAVIHAHRPGCVISSGFAGGLVSQVRKGDVILANHLIDQKGWQTEIDLGWLTGRWEPPAGAHVGRMLTVNHIPREPDEKRRLGSQNQALAFNLESVGVAEACAARNVRFLAIHVASDAVDERLPLELDHLMNQQSAAGKLGAVVGSLFRRPSSVKEMLQMKEDTLLASDRLAEILADLVGSLDVGPSPSGRTS